jgi:hypothetical protein
VNAMVNAHKLTKIIVKSLNFNNYYRIALENLIRPNADPEILQKLQLYFNNKYSSSINEYLESVNKQELDYFLKFRNYIPNSDSMNPHVKYLLKEYFVSEVDGSKLKHLDSLNMLLQNNGSMLNVIDRSRERGGILHIGENLGKVR